MSHRPARERHETSGRLWDEASVLNRVKALRNGDVAIFVTVGTSDEYFLEGNRALHAQLTDDGVEHVYMEVRGPSQEASAHNFTFQRIGERSVYPWIADFFSQTRSTIGLNGSM